MLRSDRVVTGWFIVFCRACTDLSRRVSTSGGRFVSYCGSFLCCCVMHVLQVSKCFICFRYNLLWNQWDVMLNWNLKTNTICVNYSFRTKYLYLFCVRDLCNNVSVCDFSYCREHGCSIQSVELLSAFWRNQQIQKQYFQRGNYIIFLF